MLNKKKTKLSIENNNSISKKIIISLVIILCIISGIFIFIKYGIGETEAKKDNTNVNDSINSDNTEEYYSQNSTFDLGEKLYNQKDYEAAYKKLSEIKVDAIEYDEAQEYMEICKNNLLHECINEVNSLVSEEYYTKALDELHKYRDIIGNDEEIVDKIAEIKQIRLEHINNELGIGEDTIITTDNINTLNISSPKKYMIFVSLEDQMVYIYKGYTNNWALEKSFSCSSGIEGEETPAGNFYIQNRGYSFYSEDYEQGAKYWVGFMGNYLFHSLPYNEDLTEIVDPTIGVPASHGCIRLEETDAKWIYDNIPQNARVIIR